MSLDSGPLRIVLIAGPSGAGKSTFIRQLTTGCLPPEIEGELPPEARHWSLIEANDLLKDRGRRNVALRNVESAEGALVHYDIAFIRRFENMSYESDPAAEIFRASEPVVVCLKPTSERLLMQFKSRLRRHLAGKRTSSLIWAQYVRQPIRRYRARLRGRQPAPTPEEFYRDRDGLARCYLQWDSFVKSLVREKPRGKILYVEPVETPGAGPTFRLLDRFESTIAAR
jgi:energy-coupling factor transporter ATP-binding protein EcfA2